LSGELQIDENSLFDRVAEIIETRKARAGTYANCEVTLMYWEIGRYINSVVLDSKRAEYGKRIVATLSQQLVKRYGKSFEYTKVTRMIKFAELFPDMEIVCITSTNHVFIFRSFLPIGISSLPAEAFRLPCCRSETVG